jgi:hypothetical protein
LSHTLRTLVEMPKLMFSFSLGIVILCLPTSQILTQSYAIKKKYIYIYLLYKHL